MSDYLALGTNDDVAERVKRERANRGWSLRELERRMAEAGEPMSFSLLQRLENGRGADKSRPSVTFDQTRALADVFGLPFMVFVAPAEWVKELRIAALERYIQSEQLYLAEVERSMARLTAELAALKVTS